MSDTFIDDSGIESMIVTPDSLSPMMILALLALAYYVYTESETRVKHRKTAKKYGRKSRAGLTAAYRAFNNET